MLPVVVLPLTPNPASSREGTHSSVRVIRLAKWRACDHPRRRGGSFGDGRQRGDGSARRPAKFAIRTSATPPTAVRKKNNGGR